MYSYEHRIRAVELYIKLGKRVRPTIRQLGCMQWDGRPHPQLSEAATVAVSPTT